MTHFAIYVRRSYKRADAADVSDETQLAAAKALLPAGATFEVISDSGGHRSGYSDDRAGYQRLIAKIRDGSVQGVAVYDLSRLARNARLMLSLRDELERHNVTLLIATMPQTTFDTAIGRYLFLQICGAAQLQRDLDSERMTAMTRSLFLGRAAPGQRPLRLPERPRRAWGAPATAPARGRARGGRGRPSRLADGRLVLDDRHRRRAERVGRPCVAPRRSASPTAATPSSTSRGPATRSRTSSAVAASTSASWSRSGASTSAPATTSRSSTRRRTTRA